MQLVESFRNVNFWDFVDRLTGQAGKDMLKYTT
jgi:hypothetical protein